jgi:hypothetical protein
VQESLAGEEGLHRANKQAMTTLGDSSVELPPSPSFRGIEMKMDEGTGPGAPSQSMLVSGSQCYSVAVE